MSPKVSGENAVVRRDAVVRVPSRTFVLGDAIATSVQVELGRVVPLTWELLPVLWVRGERDALRRFERRATEDDSICSLTHVETPGNSTLYRVEWASTQSPLSAAFEASDVLVRRVESRDREWSIQLSNLEPGALSGFAQECAARDIPYTIDRISATSPPDENVATGLTAAQEEAVRVASEQGYFDVPRRATLDDLGAELGISRQAVSFRLRRGMRQLVDEMLPESNRRPEG